MCGKHEKHCYHIDAIVAYDNFLTSQNPQKNIQVQIKSERGSTIKRNREIVESVAKCVHFCGKQCIALRGHRDDSTADQNGNRDNFLALLELRVDSGDEVLKNHLATCSVNANILVKNNTESTHNADRRPHKGFDNSRNQRSKVLLNSLR